MLAYPHFGFSWPDVVNGETHTLGVEAESVSAKESGIRERSESRLTLDPGVDNVYVASKRKCAIFVVAHHRIAPLCFHSAERGFFAVVTASE